MTRAICGGVLWWSAGPENLLFRDCLDSTLFAQLVADKRYSRFIQTRDWFGEFATILANLGWQNASFAFGTFPLPAVSFTLQEVVERSLRDQIDKPDLAGLLGSLAAYDDLPIDSRARTVFDDYASLEYILCPGTACVLGGGTTVADLGVRVEETSASRGCSVPDLPYIAPDPGIDFRREIPVSEVVAPVPTASAKMTLNEDIYARVRDVVIEKLGRKRTELIVFF